METSPATRTQIEQFEGLRLTAYQDVVGVWTIGYGHTGPDVTPGLTITQAQADLLMAGDLHKFEINVAVMVGQSATTQNQFDALVSFSYNLGAGALAQSHLLVYHKAGQYEQAADEFPKWDHAGGEVLSGLLRRREWERTLYLTPETTNA